MWRWIDRCGGCGFKRRLSGHFGRGSGLGQERFSIEQVGAVLKETLIRFGVEEIGIAVVHGCTLRVSSDNCLGVKTKRPPRTR